MIKIRLKLLDFNTSGSFTKAPNPNRDSDGENVIISDTITSHALSHNQRNLRLQVKIKNPNFLPKKDG
jgi:hypothetical protein